MPITKSQVLLLELDWLLWKLYINSLYSDHTLVMCVPCCFYQRPQPGKLWPKSFLQMSHLTHALFYIQNMRTIQNMIVTFSWCQLVHWFLLVTVGPSVSLGGNKSIMNQSSGEHITLLLELFIFLFISCWAQANIWIWNISTRRSILGEGYALNCLDCSRSEQ